MNKNRLSLWVASFIFCSFQSTLAFQNQFRGNEDTNTFDFIVVGGGSGGCVVAARLAENGKHTVLLVHEGDFPNINLDVPGLSTIANFPYEMKYYNSVQQNFGLAKNGSIQFPIGKAIGGATSINGMLHNRGSPQVYNMWANMTNDESWNYENLLTHFKHIENYTGKNQSDQRGYGGPVTIENANFAPSMSEFIEAGKEIGYPHVEANPQIPSVAMFDYSQKQGRRVSSFSGYIRPLLQSGRNKNLVVFLNTEAKRIIFEGNRAIGVSYIRNGNKANQLGFARAKYEIVISAGTMDSPALLIRSGIGPKSVLDAANISIVKDLPVGQNLQDHHKIQLPVIFGNRSAAFVPSRDLTPEAWKTYQKFGTGPYSSYRGSGAQGFFLSNLQNTSNANLSDIQLIPLNIEAYSPDVRDLMEGEVSVNWPLFVVQPKSKGNVSIDPDKIDNPPLIDFQYYSHPDDLNAMLDLIRLTEKICENTNAFQEIGCRLSSNPLSACSEFSYRLNEYWECYIKQVATSGLHAGGTCRMGKGDDDPDAVVDPQLRVIGIENLRVADAAIFPILPNANTQAAVYTVAEKAAFMILKRWEAELKRNSQTQNNFFGMPFLNIFKNS